MAWTPLIGALVALITLACAGFLAWGALLCWIAATRSPARRTTSTERAARPHSRLAVD